MQREHVHRCYWQEGPALFDKLSLEECPDADTRHKSLMTGFMLEPCSRTPQEPFPDVAKDRHTSRETGENIKEVATLARKHPIQSI